MSRSETRMKHLRSSLWNQKQIKCLRTSNSALGRFRTHVSMCELQQYWPKMTVGFETVSELLWL